MLANPAVKIQLASSYAGIANYWKFFDGETKQLIQHNVLAQKQKDEAAFEAWAKGKKEYDNLFADMKAAYDAWTPYAKGKVYLQEGILGSPMLAFASSLKSLEKQLANPTTPDELQKAITAAKAAREKFLQAENFASDKNIMAVVLRMFYTDIDPSQQPTEFYNDLKATYGDLTKEAALVKYAEDVFAKTFILTDAKWNMFISNPSLPALQSDIAYKTAMAFVNNYTNNYEKYFKEFTATTFALNNKYQRGILEMNKGKVLYPDANFTMRVSYGNVKSYSPRKGVKYNEVCTLNGVKEKYKPGDYEFDVPEKLLELIKNKDYGQYIDKKANDVVVTFITTNDITGGNSGSPVMNAKGELIGLAFDGNYEALSHKIAFDKDLNRTICVDVRYVLFIIDKFGGAKNIIDELQLVKQ